MRAHIIGWLLFACPATVLAVAPDDSIPRAQLVEIVQKLESDPDKALVEFDALIAQLETTGPPLLYTQALAKRCEAQLSIDPTAARAMAEAGIAVAEAQHFESELASLLVCRGYVRDTAGENAAALADYIASGEHAARAGDKGGVAQAMVLRGSIYYYRGEHARALADMQAAYQAYLELGNVKQQRFTLNEIANLYADAGVGEYDKAIEYYRQNLASHEAEGNTREMATVRFNIASTLERKGDLAAALAEFQAALELARTAGDVDTVAATERAMAGVLVKLERAPEALAPLERSLAYYLAENNADRVAHVRITRGTALGRVGRAPEALADLDAALAHYTKDDNARFLERIQQERARVLAGLGRWEEAHAALTQQLKLRERLATQLREEQTSRLRTQFDTERRDQENQALQRENTLRGTALAAAARVRNLQTAVLVLAGLVLLVFVLLLIKVRAKNRELTATNVALAASREEVVRSGRRADLIFRALTEGLAGSVLDDKYRIDARVGAGGFGTVYRAIQLNQGTSVAVKVFKPPPGQDASRALDRFRSEGLSAYRVQHRNAVRVHDFAVSMETVAYLVMEFLEGVSLADELKAHGPMSAERAIAILYPLSEALACAHAAGVVHRDVKPSNILLCVEGGVEVIKLIDFGIAKILGGEMPAELQSLTGTGFFTGTPSYMAPERFRDQFYDGRSDVYSLGIVAFEMLNGARPFAETGENFLPVALQHMNESPPDLADLVPSAPRALVRLVMDCLAKNPADRPSADQLAAALNELRDPNHLGTPRISYELPSNPDLEVTKVGELLQPEDAGEESTEVGPTTG